MTQHRRLYTGDESAARGLLLLQFAATGALLTAALFVCFFTRAKHDPGLAGLNPFADDPYDAVGSFGVQLGAVSAAVAAIRAFCTNLKTDSLSNRYTYTLRAAAVAQIAIIVTMVADLVAFARQAVALGQYPPGGILLGATMGLLLVCMGFCGYIIRLAKGREVCSKNPLWQRQMIPFLILLILLACYPAGWREGIIGSILTAAFGMTFLFLSVGLLSKAMFPCPDIPERDLIDDVYGIYMRILKRPDPRAVSAAGENKPASPAPGDVLTFFAPRSHEWNFLAVVSVIMGLLISGAELRSGSQHVDIGRGALVVLLYVGLETAGIFLGYALLKKFLGLIRSL